MTLARFKASNHPQQTRRWGAGDEVDDRATHPLNFAEFSDRFGPFTVDVAAAAHNTKCERFYDIEANGLVQDWSGENVWCNPPYSDIAPWVRKAWDSWASTTGIVMLLPANRTEQQWWQLMVEPFRDRGGVPANRGVPARPDALPEAWPDRDRPEPAPALRCGAAPLAPRRRHGSVGLPPGRRPRRPVRRGDSMTLRSKCPTGCGRPVQPRKLMCLPCWREVPKHLQTEVYRTFKAWWADRGDPEKFVAYDEARDAAIGSIR